MNADCYYEIGYSHTVCEDYALAGKINNDISFAIVCDGCSASPHVDVGARILTYAALSQLKRIYGCRKQIATSWIEIGKHTSANNLHIIAAKIG